MVVFDKDFNYIEGQSGKVAITDEGKYVPGSQDYGVHEQVNLPQEIVIQQAGYVLIYLSNETPGSEVYFDDLTIQHVTTPVIQKDDYYPFGLSIAGLSAQRDRVLMNEYLYNGKEKQELTGWYDYGARMYMADIGRWHVIDAKSDKAPGITPYRYAYNNPTRFLDPNGKYEEDGHYWTVYLLATQLGLRNASQIAKAAEWPDAALIPTYLIPGLQQKYHALTGGNAASETNQSEQMIYEAGNDLKEIGIALHRYGDSYAHRTLDDPSIMYGNPYFTINHAWKDGSLPDKISNRPSLYLNYVQNLNRILNKKFSKNIQSDMFTFKYIANSTQNTTQDNDNIFKSEINILNGVNVFEIASNSANSVKEYLKYRKEYNHQIKNYSVKTIEVTKYELNQDGMWSSHQETKSFVTIQ